VIATKMITKDAKNPSLPLNPVSFTERAATRTEIVNIPAVIARSFTEACQGLFGFIEL
jgi:hypothetical protein